MMLNSNTVWAWIFLKVEIAKIITREKILRSQNFVIFPPLEDTERNLIKQGDS